MRMAAQPTVRPQRLKSFPAPVGGWIRNLNLAVPGARKPDGSLVNGAYVLENWFPTATGIRMRGGSLTYCLVGEDTDDVTSLFTYVNGNNKKMFAATATAIFDVTTAPPQVYFTDGLGNELTGGSGDNVVKLIPSTTRATASVDSLTGGDWITVQFANASGDVYLIAVNGSDDPQIFNGTSWGTTPAITGVDPTTLSYVWVFKNRLWFLQKDSLNAYYLDADAIGGAATLFPLSGIFTRGGSLLFGAAWSLETLGGLSDQCIMGTTEGEIVAYQGTDPSTADTWSKVGLYRTGKPLGPKAIIRAGGDLVVATDIGFLPVSTSLTRDYAALSPNAVSYPIEVAWNDFVAERSIGNWNCEVWPNQQMVMIAMPTPADGTPTVLVANSRTGAWASYTGWDAMCLCLFDNRLFFGTSEGRVVEAEVTGFDDGSVPYTASCVPLFDPLKTPASLKTGLLSRAVLLSAFQITPQISLQTDYVVSLPSLPSAPSVSGDNTWGAGIWGQSIWGAKQAKTTKQQWQSVGGAGYALSPAVQISSGSLVPLDVELVSIDLTYDQSDIVT